ncbi:AI-2E family transporter [Pseudonocardia asaccharolytica]|nr:AI-2E family transporter [Pseudonocardia asaccharolytica]
MVNVRLGDRGSAIGRAVSHTSRWSLRLILIALGAALIFWLGAQLWVIVLPVLLGLLITTVLWPPAAFLRRHRWPPALAAAAVLLTGLIVLGGVITLVTVSIAGSFNEIAAGASSGLERIREWLVGPPLNLGQSQLDDALSSVTRQLQQSVSSIASGVLTGVGAVTSGVVTGVLALVLAFLFIKDGPHFLPWLRGIVGPTAGSHLSEVAVRIWRTLVGFIHTQAIVAMIDAVFIGVGLVIVGVPLALPLAVITFLGGFVPIVGAFVAGALAVLVALVSNGFTAALIVLAIVVAVQQLEGNVLQPILQSRSVQLHAAVVLLAVAAGGTLYGIAGAFLSVPIVAAAAVVLRYLSEQLDGRAGQPAPASGSSGGLLDEDRPAPGEMGVSEQPADVQEERTGGAGSGAGT